MSHPRLLVVAEDTAQATIIETHAWLGDAKYFTNAVAEFDLAENAIIDHYKVERESDSAYHMAARSVRLGRSGNMSSHTLSFGGGLVRNNIHAYLGGEGANVMFNGLYVLRGTQHVDNHLRVEHAKPHCNSWEYYKGILGDQSRGVFTGRIIVHEGAQKTDAKQSNANLLLSPDALIDTKPQLEILADDVKCTHGATVGQLDDEAIFYLRTRGVNMDAARSLLIYAFAGESIGQIRVPVLRDRLQDLLAARLPHGESLTFGRPYEYSDDFVEIVRSADRRRHNS
ncbi:MAG: Fe-S cluster assembly protein SufD [Planctomycetes bacterium]|nr:Fe-S cluster assembly protein SufD [Planctomycetota bacterium]